MSYFIYQSKKIFYNEVGTGKPVIMLHGDTASSTMFEFVLMPLYVLLHPCHICILMKICCWQ